MEITTLMVLLSSEKKTEKEISARTVVLAVGFNSLWQMIDPLNQAGVEFHEINCHHILGKNLRPSLKTPQFRVSYVTKCLELTGC